MSRFVIIILLLISLTACARRTNQSSQPPSPSTPEQSPTESAPDIRMGLSESQRRQIFDELWNEDISAIRTLDRKYPIPRLEKYLPEGNSWSVDKQVAALGQHSRAKKATQEKRTKLYKSLEATFKKELATRHGLSIEQVNQIESEGREKVWNLPKMPKPDRPYDYDQSLKKAPDPVA